MHPFRVLFGVAFSDCERLFAVYQTRIFGHRISHVIVHMHHHIIIHRLLVARHCTVNGALCFRALADECPH